MRLDRLPWIKVPPYDQILTHLIDVCRARQTHLLCIQGPNGSGKSRLLSELFHVLSDDPTSAVARLNGHDHSILPNGLSAWPNFDAPDAEHALEAWFSDLLQNKAHAYLLIDDVEALPYAQMSAVMTLFSHHPELFSKVTLVAFMGIAPAHIEMRGLLKGAEVITLTSMNMMESKQFVDSVFEHLNQNREVSIAEINQLHNLSYGYIGRLLKLLEEERPLPNKSAPRSLKGLWWLSVPVIGIVGFLSWQWWQNDPQETAKPEMPDLAVVVEEVMPPVKVVEPVPKVITVVPEPKAPVKVVKPIETVMVAPALMVKGEPIVEAAHPPEAISKAKVPPPQKEKASTKNKKVAVPYIIELSRDTERAALEKQLKGRSIPGQVQYAKIHERGQTVWIAFIGPYDTESQAIEGKKKLPASVQRLPLKVRKES